MIKHTHTHTHMPKNIDGNAAFIKTISAISLAD